MGFELNLNFKVKCKYEPKPPPPIPTTDSTAATRRVKKQRRYSIVQGTNPSSPAYHPHQQSLRLESSRQFHTQLKECHLEQRTKSGGTGEIVATVIVVALCGIQLIPGVWQIVETSPAARVLQSIVPRRTGPPKPAPKPQARSQSSPGNKRVFSGTPIVNAGGSIGERCVITDYRRFRSTHPVLGIGRMHNGIDVACRGLSGRHAVYSPVDGTLSILPPHSSNGGGLVARIATNDGWVIQNMHMLAIAAKEGKIKAGDKLGIGGAPPGHPNAGTGTGAHSHYERFKEVFGSRQYATPTDTELKVLLGS